MENFSFKEMHVGKKSMRKSQRFFIMSFITLEICLNQQIWLLCGTKHSSVCNFIAYHHHCSFQEILKSNAACRLTFLTSSSVLQLRLQQTRKSALSLESKCQQLYQTKNCATIPKIKLKQCCRCHLPPSNISMQNSPRLTSVA